jgi:hypothetical protein
MNEWTVEHTKNGGLWSLKDADGRTLIQIRHDETEYVVAQHQGQRLGKSWDEAKAKAEQIVECALHRAGHPAPTRRRKL